MALPTMTTQEIADNIVAQLASSIAQTFPLLPKAFSRVLAKALSGVFVLLYKYAGFVFLQMFVKHASWRETEIGGVKVRPLVEWGRLLGVADPVDATRAEHTVTVTVTNQTGSLAAGSQLVHAPSGVLHLVTAAVALDAATVAATIRAASEQGDGDGAGTIGNLAVGDVLSFANPLANVSTDVVVASVAVTGADAETERAYRARVETRYHTPPQGGAYADLRIWAVEAPGIIHAYPYTSPDLPGEVDVYCEATVASSGSEDGIPTTAQLVAVGESIQATVAGLANRRPGGMAVNVYGITRTAYDIEVTGLVAAGAPADAKTAIEDAVDEYLRSREPFILGLTPLPRADRFTSTSVAGIAHDAASAIGATITGCTLEIGSVEVTSDTLSIGTKAKFGAATYL